MSIREADDLDVFVQGNLPINKAQDGTDSRIGPAASDPTMVGHTVGAGGGRAERRRQAVDPAIGLVTVDLSYAGCDGTAIAVE